MPRTIILQRPAKCADPKCGAQLHPGDRAVFYGRAIYGRDCHARLAVREPQHERINQYASEHLAEGGNP